MKQADTFLTILTIGAVGAIIYTLVQNPEGVKAIFNGLDQTLLSSYRASLGRA